MSLNETQTRCCAAFREWLDTALADDARFGPPQTEDRPDGSTLTTRRPVTDDLHLLVALRPMIPQVRVGIVTDDRWKSEEIEQAVQDSGDTMNEFLELGLADAGLDWEEPPVEHYRDQGRWFSFVTPLEIDTIEALDDPAFREKVLKVINGYCLSYGKL